MKNCPGDPLQVGDSDERVTRWQSRQVVITPEVLGMRSARECQQRVEQLGLTPLPRLLYRQEHWRLDVLLAWSRANGFEYLPVLGHGSAQRR